MLKFFYCSIESIYKMFVYKVLWIFTVKCLQLFNKELYVYFCTDSILWCFSLNIANPFYSSHSVDSFHKVSHSDTASTSVGACGTFTCLPSVSSLLTLFHILSQGKNISSLSVSSFKDRNQCGPAAPKAHSVSWSIVALWTLCIHLWRCAWGEEDKWRSLNSYPKALLYRS